MLEHVNIPSRADVASVLHKLIAGELPPELAANWASGYLARSDEIDDLKVLRAIEAIGGADLPSTDRQYLYGCVDFEKWLDELMA